MGQNDQDDTTQGAAKDPDAEAEGVTSGLAHAIDATGLGGTMGTEGPEGEPPIPPMGVVEPQQDDDGDEG